MRRRITPAAFYAKLSTPLLLARLDAVATGRDTEGVGPYSAAQFADLLTAILRKRGVDVAEPGVMVHAAERAAEAKAALDADDHTFECVGCSHHQTHAGDCDACGYADTRTLTELAEAGE